MSARIVRGARRGAMAVMTAALLLVLAACANLTSAAEESSHASAAPSPSPSGDPSPRPTGPVDLTFGPVEEMVDSYWGAGWHIPFEGDERFTKVEPEKWTSQRGYTFRDEDNGCLIGLHVLVDPVGEPSEDDRTLSNRALAGLGGDGVATPQDVEAMKIYAVDDAMQQDEGAAVEFRVWQHSSQEGSFLGAARVFGGVPGGLSAQITCPTGTAASDEYKQVVRENARIFVRWPIDD